MKRFTWISLMGLLVLSMVLAACSGGGNKKLTVATDAAWPPFESINEQTKEIEGFDIDLIKAIAEKEGLELDIQNVSWDPLLAGMATCQYDLAISAMTITEERKQQFNFSDPYFAAGQIVTVRADNADITGKDDLAGKVVGAQIGTTGAFEIEKIEGATLKTYDDVGLAFQDLMNGQIDAVVADNPLALGYVGENSDKIKVVGEVFTDEYYGIAICKNNTELVAKINAGLKAVQEEGLIDQLVEKWLAGSQ
ncbi:MAG: basic amino acid ABC transporter substrate-binding protein [Chloroflexota bacterium]